jgi:hypothetical protein
VVLGWMAVGTSVLAAGALIRSHFRSDIDDLRQQFFMDYLAAAVLSSSVGSITRLFRIENDAVHWGLEIVALAVMLYSFVLLVRALRLKEPSGL